MLGEIIRKSSRNLFEKIGSFFSRFPFNPNQYTLLSLLLVVFSFYFLVNSDFLASSFSFLCAILIDLIDGAVARYQKKVTKIGAYLDTICDRYVESIILIGFLFSPLPSFFLPGQVWTGLAILGSLMTTYSKAAAKEKELVKEELKRGFFGRFERVTLILFSIFLGNFNPDFSIYLIVILAIFSNFTALQRIYLVLHVK